SRFTSTFYQRLAADSSEQYGASAFKTRHPHGTDQSVITTKRFVNYESGKTLQKVVVIQQSF
ncbi:hypothetical protein ACDH53_19880, partial [Pseudomonas tremae]